jgi:hypothetical protein
MAKVTKKKQSVVHYKDGQSYTACGVDIYDWSKDELKAKTRTTWAAIQNNEWGCKRCLAVKAKLDAAKAVGRKAVGRKKAVKKLTEMGCCGG